MNEPKRMNGSDLMATLVNAIAYHRDHVVIEVAAFDDFDKFRVTVDRADMPRVVGKGGKHIWAIKAIMLAAGMHSGRRYLVELLDPVQGEYERLPRRPSEDWNQSAAVALADTILSAILYDKFTLDITDVDSLTSILRITLSCYSQATALRKIEYDQPMRTHLESLMRAIGNTLGRELEIQVIEPKRE